MTRLRIYLINLGWMQVSTIFIFAYAQTILVAFTLSLWQGFWVITIDKGLTHAWETSSSILAIGNVYPHYSLFMAQTEFDYPH